MTFSLSEAALLTALVVTCVCVLAMYVRLRRLDRHQAEYERTFARTSDALDATRLELARFRQDGRDLTVALDERIAAAQSLLEALDRRSGDGTAGRSRRQAG
jgi:uncharacterized coiled-coil protein SlyX